MYDASSGCWRRSGGKDIGRKGEVDDKSDADEDQQDDANP
jgi:hypothetical protein